MRGLRSWERAVLALLVAGSVAIAVSPGHPAMNDASSHIATAVIADRLLDGDAFTRQHYAFVAVPLPYWTTTAAMVPLLRVLDPIPAFYVLLTLYLIGLPLAFWFLLRTVAPGRTALALVGALTVFNWAYYLGEANFFLSQPLLLLAFALFLRLRALRSGAFAGFLAASTALYFSHIFGLIALLAAAGMLILRDLWARLRRRPGGRLNGAQWAAVGWSAALFGLATWLIFFQHGSEANAGAIAFDLSPYRLVQVLSNPLKLMTRRSPWPAVLFTGAVVVVALGPRLRELARGGRARLGEQFHLELLLPAAGLWVLSYAGPAGLQDAYFYEDIGQRFNLAAFLFTVGALKVTDSPRWRAALLALVLGFAGLKLHDAWQVHRGYDRKSARLSSELLARVPEHSRVVPLLDLAHPGRFDFLYIHYANYAVVERASYSPHVFARTGQQALRHLPRGDYRRIEDKLLTDAEWAFYDFVLVQGDRDPPDVPGLAERAALVGQVDEFRLYRIHH